MASERQKKQIHFVKIKDLEDTQKTNTGGFAGEKKHKQ